MKRWLLALMLVSVSAFASPLVLKLGKYTPLDEDTFCPQNVTFTPEGIRVTFMFPCTGKMIELNCEDTFCVTTSGIYSVKALSSTKYIYKMDDGIESWTEEFNRDPR